VGGPEPPAVRRRRPLTGPVSTPHARITADTDAGLIAERLRAVADYLDASDSPRPPRGMEPSELLAALEGIADVIAAGAPNGPLRERRQNLYKVLLARQVKREEIALAAGVSVPAIGFSIGSERRKAKASRPPGKRNRRPRPG
jgi:hypothetical protein